MTPILPAVGDRLTPTTSRPIVDVLVLATGAHRSACGQTVALLLVNGCVTQALLDLHARATALLDGDRGPNRCPRCLEAGPMHNGDHCRACEVRRVASRKPGAQAVAMPPEPTPVAILDRFDIEDVIAMCSRKKAYPSCVDAERVADRCFRHRRVRLRAYACPACRRWHLTKQMDVPAMEAR